MEDIKKAVMESEHTDTPQPYPDTLKEKDKETVALKNQLTQLIERGNCLQAELEKTIKTIKKPENCAHQDVSIEHKLNSSDLHHIVTCTSCSFSKIFPVHAPHKAFKLRDETPLMSEEKSREDEAITFVDWKEIYPPEDFPKLYDKDGNYKSEKD